MRSLEIKGDLSRKFWTDTIWNYLSLGVQALVGVALNVIIVIWLGADSLGVFNQMYAIFVIAGQIFVLGLHDSAQKHVAEFNTFPAEKRTLSIAALAVAFVSGIAGAFLLFLSSGLIGRIAESENLRQGVVLLAPGLFFFCINKVLMGILNGGRRMVAFAAGQAARALCILFVCVAIVVLRRPSYEFGFSFTAAEVFLLIILIGFARPVHRGPFRTMEVRQWLYRHIIFGSKALIHGFLSEAFLRIDIIMLGIFLSDREVGVYSFVALFVEGVYQVSIVVRNITNPILVALLLQNDKRSLLEFARRVAVISFSATLGVSTVIVLIYPHLGVFLPVELIDSSYRILLILMGGLLVYSGFIPFDYIFLDAGRPGTQSLFMLFNTMTNVGLNLALIPLYGLYGACIATVASFFFSIVTLNLFAWQILGLPGGFLLIMPSRTI